jgi:hypothetical protein
LDVTFEGVHDYSTLMGRFRGSMGFEFPNSLSGVSIECVKGSISAWDYDEGGIGG